MNQTKLRTFKKVSNITIIGRRWFDKTYGNTYHSSEIYVDGDFVHKIECAYGYGDQYIWTSWEWLKNNDYVKECEYGSLSIWCRENNIKLINSVSDVKRKKDL